MTDDNQLKCCYMLIGIIGFEMIYYFTRPLIFGLLDIWKKWRSGKYEK